MDAIAEDVRNGSRSCRILATPETSAAFAGAWSARTGSTPSEGCRSASIGCRVRPPFPPVRAGPARGLCVRPRRAGSMVRGVHGRGASRSRRVTQCPRKWTGRPPTQAFVVWEDPGRSVLSFAGVRRAHAERNPDRARLHAPPLVLRPWLRRCLYRDVSGSCLVGGAASAPVHRPADPTSNRLYERLGYEPVCDLQEITFGEAPAGRCLGISCSRSRAAQGLSCPRRIQERHRASTAPRSGRPSSCSSSRTNCEPAAHRLRGGPPPPTNSLPTVAHGEPAYSLPMTRPPRSIQSVRTPRLLLERMRLEDADDMVAMQQDDRFVEAFGHRSTSEHVRGFVTRSVANCGNGSASVSGPSVTGRRAFSSAAADPPRDHRRCGRGRARLRVPPRVVGPWTGHRDVADGTGGRLRAAPSDEHRGVHDADERPVTARHGEARVHVRARLRLRPTCHTCSTASGERTTRARRGRAGRRSSSRACPRA